MQRAKKYLDFLMLQNKMENKSLACVKSTLCKAEFIFGYHLQNIARSFVASHTCTVGLYMQL